MTKLALYLLLAIVLLLGYQFVYKEYAYRRDVITERDAIRRELKERWSEIERLKVDRDLCLSRSRSLSRKCENVEIEFERKVREGAAIEARLNSLYGAVLARYGVAASWWSTDNRDGGASMYEIDWFAIQLLAAAALLGLIPAFIADKKGRSFVGWWLFGAALFIIALPIILILDPVEGGAGKKKRCPKCAEWIERQAIVCRFCGYEYGPQDDLRIA